METQIRAEKLETERMKWLKISLIGFSLFYGIHIVQNYLPEGQFSLVLIPLILTGTVIFMIAIYKIVGISKQIQKDAQLNEILNDEFVTLNRLKSWKTGFITLLFTQVIIVLISTYYPFSAISGAEISIFTGVVSAHIAFIYYHR